MSGPGDAARSQVAGWPPLLVIAGPTATGKTGLSIRLADALAEDGVHVEVISADARQVYRGLDIGTAKVDRAIRDRIPHHGLDLVDPDVRYSVADFARHAASALQRIAGRGDLAILVGGTGLYLRSVARGLALDALPSDSVLRQELEAELASTGSDALARRLERIAPCLASRTDLRNPRRVVRALEIALLRGDGPPPAPLGYPGASVWIGLDAPRSVHATWIALRARQQFEAGLVEEARALRHRWDPELPAFTAIGYHEAWAVIDGEVDLEAAIDRDARRNIAFARRQRTWFRSEPGVDWLDATVDALDAVLTRARGLIDGASRPSRVS